MAAKLTQKMSEITDAIGGHYPNYIQRALLSANLKTIQEALSFLNKLQINRRLQLKDTPFERTSA
jgi:hypothetical protein